MKFLCPEIVGYNSKQIKVVGSHGCTFIYKQHYKPYVFFPPQDFHSPDEIPEEEVTQEFSGNCLND